MRRLFGILAFFSLTGTALAQDEAVEPDSDDQETRDFVLDPVGYVRMGFDYVFKDDEFDFIGRYPGFVAANVRVGLDGHHEPSGFGFRASVEGAVDTGEDLNQPQADLDVRLRDAYVRWRCRTDMIEVRVGQMRPPFSGEEDRSTSDLRFIDRALGEEGVAVGQGFELAGLDPGRQLGLWAGSPEPIELGPIELGYAVMVANGAGENQFLNDNRQFAYYGRLTLGLFDAVRIGVGGLYNARTEGTLPDIFDETDIGLVADLLFVLEGLELYGQFMMIKTDYPTVGSPNRTQLAAHGQIAYDFQLDDLRLGPAYRYAMLRPYHDGGGDSLEDYQVQEHTVGLRGLYDVDFGTLGAFLEFTLALEDDAREVDNHRIQALVQLEY